MGRLSRFKILPSGGVCGEMLELLLGITSLWHSLVMQILLQRIFFVAEGGGVSGVCRGLVAAQWIALRARREWCVVLRKLSLVYTVTTRQGFAAGAIVQRK